MLNYNYECCKCHKNFNVITIGSEVVIDNDYEHPVEKLEDVKCPKCGGEVCCTYNPLFDDYE